MLFQILSGDFICSIGDYHKPKWMYTLTVQSNSVSSCGHFTLVTESLICFLELLDRSVKAYRLLRPILAIGVENLGVQVGELEGWH